MKLIKYFLIVSFISTSFITAQNKEITLEDIWDGTFRTERMDALHSMKNGQQYSVLDFDRKSGSTSIDVYDYKSLEKVKTIISSADIEAIQYFTNYTFSADESQILLATEVESTRDWSMAGR